jgi:pyruvate/2-oxoglutarate/acetoin dehydrogenase E1 component
MTYLQSLRNALHEAFAKDSRVYLIGEDVLDPYGGAFKVTAGLQAKYPDRVLTTPISEAALIGMSTGMAMRGLLPVVEIMFGDFLLLAADQLVNHATKFASMYKGKVRVASVIRTPMGAGRGYGPTHSQSLEKMFLGTPNLTVVSPTHAHDPGALLLHAILDDPGVVLFIEHKLLYPLALVESGKLLSMKEVAEPNGYGTVLLKNYQAGTPDVTLIAYGGMSRICVAVMEQLAAEEVRILAAFPASLKPLPMATLRKAAEETGRVVIVEEGTEGFNWGSEVAARLYESLWRKLQAPIKRVASLDTVLPAAKRMEDQVMVRADTVQAAILEVMQ